MTDPEQTSPDVPYLSQRESLPIQPRQSKTFIETWRETALPVAERLKPFDHVENADNPPSWIVNPLNGEPMDLTTPLPNMTQYRGRSTRSMPVWLSSVLKEQGFRPEEYYTQNRAISEFATASNGA
jgi:hypothetical protein